MIARAHHEPEKLEEMLKAPIKTNDIGLETEPWYELPESEGD